MPICRIDHLVVTAPSLEAGARHLREVLGVEPEAGGQHAGMGTHNLLLRLGDSTYLEILAVDPRAATPARPRWFGLDVMAATAPPRLAAWVARTSDIHAAAAASPVALGAIEEMHRGALTWLVTIPAAGNPPMGGVAPALIQWPAGTHPTTSLRDTGCSLIRLTGHHPEAEQIAAMLSRIGFEGPFSVVSTPAGAETPLVATIQTPAGTRFLGPSTHS